MVHSTFLLLAVLGSVWVSLNLWSAYRDRWLLFLGPAELRAGAMVLLVGLAVACLGTLLMDVILEDLPLARAHFDQTAAIWATVGVLTVVEVVDWVVGGPTAGLGPGLRRMILVLLILSIAANLLVLAIRRGALARHRPGGEGG
ncbi:MAG: hypothetical protein RJQ04_00750 [Longimicrobiales bacterium]